MVALVSQGNPDTSHLPISLAYKQRCAFITALWLQILHQVAGMDWVSLTDLSNAVGYRDAITSRGNTFVIGTKHLWNAGILKKRDGKEDVQLDHSVLAAAPPLLGAAWSKADENEVFQNVPQVLFSISGIGKSMGHWLSGAAKTIAHVSAPYVKASIGLPANMPISSIEQAGGEVLSHPIQTIDTLDNIVAKKTTHQWNGFVKDVNKAAISAGVDPQDVCVGALTIELTAVMIMGGYMAIMAYFDGVASAATTITELGAADDEAILWVTQPVVGTLSPGGAPVVVEDVLVSLKRAMEIQKAAKLAYGIPFITYFMAKALCKALK